MRITKIQQFGEWFVKRDDWDEYSAPDFPSGIKARNFIWLADAKPGAPIVIGCAANSTAQIAASAVACERGRKAIIYVPKREQRTPATLYAERRGAEIVECSPGYLTVCEARARERAKEFKEVVTWSTMGVAVGSAEQCQNLPVDINRVIVPTGAGATCAGIMAGLGAMARLKVKVLAITVSSRANQQEIERLAGRITFAPLPALEIAKAAGEYDDWRAACLPDGSILDPFYAAKALPFVKAGDLLWVPGCRPLSAMPKKCQEELANLKRIAEAQRLQPSLS